jgi:hypothetical protein
MIIYCFACAYTKRRTLLIASQIPPLNNESAHMCALIITGETSERH